MTNLITTSRLILREYTEADFDGIHTYAKDPETVRFMTWGPNTSEETLNFIQLAIFQQTTEPRENYHFIVSLKKNNQIIGGGGIHMRQPSQKGAEIGNCFNKRFWEPEFATETTGALLKFGFETYRCTGPSPGVIPKTSTQNA